MTVKEYLSQAFKLDKQIKAKEAQIQNLKDMQYSIGNTLSLDKVQSSHNHDKLGDLTAQVLDLQDEYAEDIERLLYLKNEIKSAIEKVDNIIYRLILEERYVNLKRWEDIAVDNNYNWRTVHKIHSKALMGIEGHTVM